MATSTTGRQLAVAIVIGDCDHVDNDRSTTRHLGGLARRFRSEVVKLDLDQQYYGPLCLLLSAGAAASARN